ncbi:MAG: NAD(P)H-dependent glycerol-3-phosphate dehydrogenase, partial [Gammaproteobacteria bacterium]
ICDGIGFAANTRSALITRGVAELLKLAEKLGADIKTIIGLSGMGDIVLTCCNNQSRNRKFGLLLAKGMTVEQAKMEIGQAIEALDNIESLYKLAVNYKVNMPIVAAIWKILNQQLPVNQAIDFLLSNEPQLEY